MTYPVFLMEVAVEPKRREDHKRLLDVLAALTAQSADFGYAVDHESGQMILKGQGESELEALVLRLKGEFGIEANVGAPQVAYCETITRTVEHSYTHKKPYSGFARVKIRFESAPPGAGFSFQNAAAETAVSSEYLPGVTRGLLLAAESGVIAGFPVIDFKTTLLDGAQHPVDSSVMAFDIAARACFREAIPKAGPKLLEPIMIVEVVTPEEYLGDVIGDLNLRRGQVRGMETRGTNQVVTALAPLSNLFGYPSAIGRMTGRRGSFTQQFLRYDPVPNSTPDDDFPSAMAMRP